MAESYSVEAILSVYDKGFTSGMERAGSLARGLSQQSTSTSGGILKMGGAFGLAAAAASKGMQIVSGAMDGAINRFDTLNKYPVVMKALGYSVGDVAKSAKLMSNGIDGLPTSLDEITSSAQQLAPLTGSATKAAKSALALNNAFLASGASVADTSRGLQQYTQMLSTGKVDMMSWRTLMETMPIALRKVAKSFGFTGKSAETDLYEALKKGKISVDDLNNAFIKLNKGQGGFADLAKKNSAGIKTSLANLKNSVVKNMGNMLQAINQGFANAGLGSIAGQLNNLKGAINGFFQAITPVVTGVSTVILQVLGGVFRFIQSNSNWLAPLAIGVGSFIGTIAGLSKVISIVNSVKNSFSLLNWGIKLAQLAADGFFALLSVNPFVIVIAAIAAVVGALIWFFTQTESGKKAWSDFCKVATDAWNAFYPLIKPAIDGIVNAWNGFVSAVSNAWSAIAPALGQLAQQFGGLFQTLAPLLQPIIKLIGGALVGAIIAVLYALTIVVGFVSGIVQIVAPIITFIVQLVMLGASLIMTALQAAFDTVIPYIMSAFGSLADFFSGIWQVIVGIFQVFAGLLSGNMSLAWTGIKNIVAGAWKAVTAPLSAVWSIVKGLFNAGVAFIRSVVHVDLSGNGRAIMESLYQGLLSVWGKIKGFISKIAGWIHANKGPVSYDKRLLIENGQAIMFGLNRGLADGFGDVQSTVVDMAGSISDLMSPTLSPDYSGLSDLPQIGERAFNSNYSGSMQIQESTLQQENNRLLRQIADKNSNIYLDGETLVGATISETNSQLGNQVNLEGRWG